MRCVSSRFLIARAAVVGGVIELAGETFDHRLLRPSARLQHQPPHSERDAARRSDLDRHLVGGATDASGAHFDERLHVVERLLEDRQRLFLGALLNEIERPVERALGQTLLALDHDGVHELGDHPIVELPDRAVLRDDEPLPCAASDDLVPYFGFFAPYFERPCRRSCTPIESSVPRTMW